MSFIAGYIAGLGEGGNAYKNEPKTITANGEYVPDEGVRWDKVTVDVPAAQNYGEIFGKIPTYCGWTFCNNKWVILFKITDGFGTDLDGTSSFSYHTHESDGAIYSDLYGERKLHWGYICIYKNGTNFVYATRTSIYAEDSYNYGGTDSGVTSYKTSEFSSKCIGVENPTYSIAHGSFLSSYVTVKGTVHFAERTIYRDGTGKVINDITVDVTKSLYDNVSISASGGFSDLSVYDRYGAFIEFGKDLNSLII